MPARGRRGRADVRAPARAGVRGRAPAGQSSFIYEAGACVVLDGEEHWLTGELLPGELTIAEQIERSGAPALLLEQLRRSPRVPRALASRARGLAPVPRARRLRRGGRAAARARPRRAAPDRQRRRQSPLARRSPRCRTCAAITCCRPAPRRRRPSPFTAARAATRARETFAVGDSREDLACAAAGRRLLAGRQRARARPLDARVRSPRTRTCAWPRPATAPASTRR